MHGNHNKMLYKDKDRSLLRKKTSSDSRQFSR